MNKNMKIAIFGILSFVLPFVGIPLLIITIVKDENKNSQSSISAENQTNHTSKITVEENQEKNCMNNYEMDLQREKSSYKIPKGKIKIFISIITVAVLIMITGVVLALTVGDVGNTILLVAGTIEFIIAVVIYAIEHNKILYTCPECGTKREQHIELVDTKTNVKGQKTNLYRSSKNFIDCTIISYTYRYKYTYVCPNCGEETTEYHSEHGGCIYQYIDGIVIDKVKVPKCK